LWFILPWLESDLDYWDENTALPPYHPDSPGFTKTLFYLLFLCFLVLCVTANWAVRCKKKVCRVHIINFFGNTTFRHMAFRHSQFAICRFAIHKPVRHLGICHMTSTRACRSLAGLGLRARAGQVRLAIKSSSSYGESAYGVLAHMAN